MRSKIVFFVILMLSFVIVHDTALALVDQHKKATIVAVSADQLSHDKSANMHDIHSMFHFSALICSDTLPIDIHNNKMVISYTLPKQTLSCKKTIIKPPIA